MDRIAFWNASLYVLPMLITSPTARICVPRRSSTPLNFSKSQRQNFTTTYSPHGAYRSSVPSFQYGISSSVSPPARSEETIAMGKPVALDARAEERDVRGLISITTTRPVLGSCANWTLVPPMTSMDSTIA
jgi:hypothetical protein